MQRKGKQRITIDLPDPIYRQLKLAVRKHNVTMTRFITRLLVYAIKRDLEIK